MRSSKGIHCEWRGDSGGSPRYVRLCARQASFLAAWPDGYTRKMCSHHALDARLRMPSVSLVTLPETDLS